MCWDFISAPWGLKIYLMEHDTQICIQHINIPASRVQLQSRTAPVFLAHLHFPHLLENLLLSNLQVPTCL